MGSQRGLSQEARERAVGMVFDHQGQCASRWEAVRGQEGQGAEVGHDRLLVAGTVEAPENFPVDEFGGQNEIAFCEGSRESAHRWPVGRWVAAQCRRPHARSDEEAQSRERSR